MAFDGITVSCVAHELNEKLAGGRISKIAQPETDELLLTIKTREGNFRLLLSASASLPLIYLTESNKNSPLTAPNFCMLLRKHISGGRILSVTQPSLERILRFEIEHLDEMGDLCKKYLVVEIMGKHSNIIFCSGQDMIIDSIKHVSSQMSSVREVLPGRPYFIPETQEKADPLSVTEEQFLSILSAKSVKLSKALYTSLTGLSPIAAEEVCCRASLDSDRAASSYETEELIHLYRTFCRFLEPLRFGGWEPAIYYDGKTPVEYSCLPLTIYGHFRRESYDSVSAMLEHYYAERNTLTRIRQKSTDLRRIVQTALERNVKKYDLQAKQLKDTEKREKYRVYGELINAYGYNVESGSKSFEAVNYYTGETVTVPLDPQISIQSNASRYFDKYGKLKRTCEAVTKLLEETSAEIEHLKSIQTALDIALQEEDLVQIKEELMESGYIRKRAPGNRRPKITSKPFHYLSGDGFHIYVGKNNFQNDELTFQFARGNDWWFHAKGIPGSHVIVQTEGKELPDRTFEEAARLAAYYSAARGADKVEIDYVEKKHVKKPNGSKPGFVVYYTNYSMMIDSDISGIAQI